MKKYDVRYNNVRFDSFVALNAWLKRDDETVRTYRPISLKYYGNDLCGDVEIDCAPGNSKIRNEVIVQAATTLKFF